MQTRLELYQLVAPLAALGIWERNFITGDVYWNTTIREILEVDDEFLPALDNSISFYKDQQRIRDLISQAISGGRSELEEAELVTAKGNAKYVKIRMQAVFEAGECISLYGTLEDITNEVKLRQQSAEREQRFYQAFNYAPIGMALVSLKGEWIRANNSICDLLGYAEADLIKRTFQELTHPDDLELDLEQLNQVLAGKINSYSMEKRYFHQDGHLIWALLNVSLVRDNAGEPLYFVSQIKDISERKKHMETIRDQNDRLLNFAHIVSHNLRSHTGNIQMLTDMVMEEPDPSEKDNLIKMLHVNANNLLETLTQLNEVVKVHDNGLNNRKQLNLIVEVERVLHILSASLKQARAKVIINIDKQTTVLFNPAYLESILINLVSNSIRYKQAGSIPQINITATEDIEKLTIRFSDNGVGIDLDLHGHKLFGMYKTFHGNDDARGMGLFLVKNQVEAMGGKIIADSRPGHGTTFTIQLYKK